MLNRVILMGRITHELEVKQTPAGVPVVSFSVAVDRNYSGQNGERQTDFINCVAWRQQADFIGKYFGKGRMIAIEGNLRTRTYDDKNGTKHYVTEVYVDSVSFTGEARQQSGNYQNNYSNGGYQNQYNAAPQNNYSKPQQNNYSSQPQQDSMSIGGMQDFEEIISDDGVPF
jgi:single-strand DNA-binding protein